VPIRALQRGSSLRKMLDNNRRRIRRHRLNRM
jgi:hypothetical protein